MSVWKLARRFFEIMHVSPRAHETDILHLGAQTHSILPFRLNSGFYPSRSSTVLWALKRCSEYFPCCWLWWQLKGQTRNCVLITKPKSKKRPNHFSHHKGVFSKFFSAENKWEYGVLWLISLLIPNFKKNVTICNTKGEFIQIMPEYRPFLVLACRVFEWFFTIFLTL